MITASTVRIVRAFFNLSQSELAERMGVSVSLISSVEKGTKRITSDFVRRFKRAVGITDAVLIDIAYLQGQIAE